MHAGCPHQAKSRLFSHCPQDLEGRYMPAGRRLQSNVEAAVAADAADRHFRWSRRALKCRIQNVPEVVPSMPDFYSGLLSVYLPPLGRFLIPVHWLADRAIAQLLWARAPPTLPGPALASRHANLAKPPGSVITHRVYYCCGRHRPAVNIRSPDTTPDGSCRRCLVQCRVEPRRLPGPQRHPA